MNPNPMTFVPSLALREKTMKEVENFLQEVCTEAGEASLRRKAMTLYKRIQSINKTMSLAKTFEHKQLIENEKEQAELNAIRSGPCPIRPNGNPPVNTAVMELPEGQKCSSETKCAPNTSIRIWGQTDPRHFISAIKVVRDMTGLGLKQAKEYLECAFGKTKKQKDFIIRCETEELATVLYNKLMLVFVQCTKE